MNQLKTIGRYFTVAYELFKSSIFFTPNVVVSGIYFQDL